MSHRYPERWFSISYPRRPIFLEPCGVGRMVPAGKPRITWRGLTDEEVAEALAALFGNDPEEWPSWRSGFRFDDPGLLHLP